jgi:hypothetical protein
MRKRLSALLKSWIKEFQAGLRSSSNTTFKGRNWRIAFLEPERDNHFLEQMFSLFSHQSTLSARRIGRVDCTDMSIINLASNATGPAPFSRSWAKANALQRREKRRINYLLKEIISPEPFG